MSLLKEISAITVRHYARQWKPRVREYDDRWVCHSDYPMKSVAAYGKTCPDAFEAWVRAYHDLLLNLRR